MNLKKKLFLIVILFLIFSIVGCNSQNSKTYSPSKTIPLNVRENFYMKSVEVVNFYIKKVETNSLYTDDDNEYLLGYYRSMPSKNSEELTIKTSISYLDIAYKNFEENLKKHNESEIEQSINEFNVQKEEALKLLLIEPK